MPPKPKQPKPVGPTRYRYSDITENVEEYLSKPENKGMRKRFEAVCGKDHSAFSHCMSEYRGERFKIEHFGAMAAEANAPEPWPFVSWKLAEAFQGVRALMEATKKGDHK
ncbi:hypothetical protein [Anaeromyxobacter oryzisoli]|uniref:hypothetical protein n=1 Tax=Anaeromyxobacter oryzisoli TaxID=2925408 RepID=UPI001F58D06D|nr:hypothetical protein [Anaeromyxobacter sp. SG63]